MNETSPLEKQDLSPIYYKLDKVIELLQELLKILEVKK